MKVYHLEYNIQFPNGDHERRKCSTTDLAQFIEDVKSTTSTDKWYISDIKTYVGVLQEIDPSKVVDPF